MKLTLNVWRQKVNSSKGDFVKYDVNDIDEHMSFLEMLDVLNDDIITKGEDPIAYDHDCREGICGCCSLTINGRPHGEEKNTTTCQLHMRKFKDGETIYIEPFRAKAFPVVKDLVVDRSAFDRIQQAGGFVSIATGHAPDANALPVPKEKADKSMDAAQCIGCGACVAACPNGAAMLFVGAKVSQYALLPQGQAERKRRALAMVSQMDKEGFGACSNHYECEAACPKSISVNFIAMLNRELVGAAISK